MQFAINTIESTYTIFCKNHPMTDEFREIGKNCQIKIFFIKIVLFSVIFHNLLIILNLYSNYQIYNLYWWQVTTNFLIKKSRDLRDSEPGALMPIYIQSNQNFSLRRQIWKNRTFFDEEFTKEFLILNN